MAKTRSPQYPAIGLKEAVDKVTAVYEKDYQNPIPRAVAVSHMGYLSLNGKSLGVLSALLKYGLLEGRGDDTRVSELAVGIIAHPPGSPERAAALKEASSKPELFSELDSRFQSGKASDQAIRSYLLTQKFIPTAADSVIRSYRETKQLVEAESAGYATETLVSGGVEVHMPPAAVHIRGTPPTFESAEPFRVSFTGSGIEVTARLTDPASADELIRSINALKLLLRPASDFKKPESEQ